MSRLLVFFFFFFFFLENLHKTGDYELRPFPHISKALAIPCFSLMKREKHVLAVLLIIYLFFQLHSDDL